MRIGIKVRPELVGYVLKHGADALMFDQGEICIVIANPDDVGH